MTEQDRLTKLLEQMDQQTSAAFLKFVAIVKSDKVFGIISDLLEAGRVDDAMAIVDTYISSFGSVISRNFVLASTARGADAVRAVARINPAVGVSFSPGNPRAAALAETQKLDLVRRITDEQRTSIRTSLVDSMLQGKSSTETARAFKNSIGLTDSQLRAVENYRALLERGSASALSRGLRDQRYQPGDMDSLARRQEYVKALEPDQIDRMVDAYRNKYVKFRADTIAQTESGRTLSEAGDEAFRQTLEMAGIDPATVEKTWNSTKDKRTRDSHANMEERVVMGMDSLFVTGLGNRMRYPLDSNAPAADVIRCRCVTTYRIT